MRVALLLARVRGEFRGGQARLRQPVDQPANPEADGATRATRAPTGGIARETGAPDEIVGPPWPLLAAGGPVAQSLYLPALIQVVTVGGQSGHPSVRRGWPQEPRMIYGSVCSGIEAVTVAWEPLGFQPAWFAEIDPFCSVLLSHHYPHVSNRGDFTRIAPDGTAIDILAGGTPCQAFSIAGRRGGLDDARGNLAIEFCRLAGRLRPRWIVWENVPGVLSSNSGRDFSSIIGALAELGYGCAWRVLDAQFLGVPQRRRRVFVVGHLGDWRRAVAVLLEPESLCRDTPARRKAWEDVAGCPGGGTGERGWCNDTDRMTFVPETAYGLNAKGGVGRMDAQANETFVVHTLRGGTPH